MVRMGVWEEKKVFLVQIREYTKGKDGFHLATEKGIALTK